MGEEKEKARLAEEKLVAAKIAQERAATEKKSQLVYEAKIKQKVAEEDAIKKAEAELQEQLRLEKINKEIEAAVAKKQEEAQKKFDTAKKVLEQSGAEFVSNEEFAKIKKASKSAGAA